MPQQGKLPSAKPDRRERPSPLDRIENNPRTWGMDRLERLSRKRNQSLRIETQQRGMGWHAFINLPSGGPIASGRGGTKEEAIENALREAEG